MWSLQIIVSILDPQNPPFNWNVLRVQPSTSQMTVSRYLIYLEANLNRQRYYTVFGCCGDNFISLSVMSLLFVCVSCLSEYHGWSTLMYATVHLSTDDGSAKSAAATSWILDANATGTTNKYSVERASPTTTRVD